MKRLMSRVRNLKRFGKQRELGANAHSSVAPSVTIQNMPSAHEANALHPQRQQPQRLADPAIHSLETLPVEIQCAIMAESASLESLRALVHASPFYYRVYSQNRLSILRAVLGTTLDGIVVDAYATYRSEPEVRHLIPFDFDDYIERQLYGACPNPATKDLSLSEVTEMATFHISVVQPLTDLYAHWALGALSSSLEAVPLSRVEVARIQRAIYRLQTICNCRIGSRAALLGLLDAFSPWESEEILCVHAFAEERCTSAFIMAAWDLNQDRNPKYRSISIFDTNEALLLYENDSKSISPFRIPVRLLIHFSGVINGNSLVSLLCQGPQVLIELFSAKDSEELAEVLENRVCYSIYEDNWINAAGKHTYKPCQI